MRGKKQLIGDVKSFLFGNGIDLLTTIFINSHQPLQLRCISCNNQWFAALYSIKNGTGCPRCSKDRRKKTVQERYGVNYISQSSIIRKKIENTCLERYGVISPSQNSGVKDKIKQTNLKKYGVKSPLQNKDILQKVKQTNLQKYGVECPFDINRSENNIKIKKTFLEKFHGGPLSSEPVLAKFRKTCMQRYGADNCMKIKEIRLRAAKSANKITILKHWFSREDVCCQGSYEVAVVKWLNKNKIDFNWEPQTFLMPSGRTYTPDLYLPDQDLWVEIKGRFYDDAKEKWDWFREMHPNSELWGKNKLKEMEIL